LYTKYVEHGLSVIPLSRKTKRPFMDNWSRYCETLASTEELESWESDYAGWNIGLCLGPASGVVAVDIDTENERTLDIVPASPVRKRGKKGETRFFRFNSDIISRKYHHLGVEILANGNQTVLPPSIHPETGQPYVWLTPDTLLDVDPKSLPELDLSFLEILPRLDTEATGHVAAGGRNNKLVELATAMRTRGETEEKTVVEVYTFDKDNHAPRLFTDAKEGYRAKDEHEAINNAWKFVSSVTRTLISKKLAVLPDQQPEIPEVDVSALERAGALGLEVIEGGEGGQGGIEPLARVQMKPLPLADGLIKTLQDEILRLSPAPQPTFALAGALSILGAFCQGRYSFQGTWPTLFTLLVGGTGYGKDAPRSMANQLLSHPQLKNYNLQGLGSYVSLPATILSLPEQRTRLDVIDEFSGFLKGTAHPSGFRRDVAVELTKLWSMQGGKYLGNKAACRRETGACFGPAVGVMALCQPETLIAACTPDLLNMGFLPRFLMFFADKEVPFNKEFLFADRSVDALASELKRRFPRANILPAAEGDDGSISTDLGAFKPKPVELGVGSGLKERWIELADYFHAQLHAAGEDVVRRAFLSRAHEQATRIAIIVAISAGRETLEQSDLDWAAKLVDTLILNSHSVVAQAAATSEYGRLLEQMRQYFSRQSYASPKLLAQRFRIGKRLRDALVKDLLEEGAITEGKSSGKTVYFAALG
jgi:hypothetical protein